MNALARVIHASVTRRAPAAAPHLSPSERAALANLRPLLQQPPRKLCALLSQIESAGDWYALESPSRTDRAPDL